ncbi:MAG: phytoene desaturase [Cyclobacteriaceae bacterium]|nr:phytoene desaturase [Cyclobacteriaceae bacterium SS2]
MNKAIVIGSGIAGLASALRLRSKGYEVKVFEANAFTGGKIHAFTNQGYRFDFGPSLFTMPHLVDELFELFDRDPKVHFEYIRKDTICNYFWEDGHTFTAPADKQQFIEQAARSFWVEEQTLENYLTRNKEKYDLTARLFLEKSLHKLNTYLSQDTLRSILQIGKLHLGNTLNGVNQSYFNDSKLVQLFNRYATYNGSSPYQTPGIMSLIPHLEMHFGTYFPKKGMHDISQSLYHLAKDEGIEFHLEEPVEKILTNNHRVSGIKTIRGTYEAEIVISNMDIFSTYKTLLPDAKQPKRTLNQERSSSALIFYWGINRQFPELDLHNIFFSNNYSQEFDHIFNKLDLFRDPTVYINITSKDKPDDAPPGCENWFVMINAPGNVGQDWDKKVNEARKNIIQKLNRVLKTRIEDHIVTEDIVDPRTIESKTRSHQGSLYGTSSNSKFAAFLRHPNFSSQYKNLFFCGGSVHPGGGIPLCLLSAKIATDQIPSV